MDMTEFIKLMTQCRAGRDLSILIVFIIIDDSLAKRTNDLCFSLDGPMHGTNELWAADRMSQS